MSTNREIDKDYLYGRFEKGEKFKRKLAHKAVDMADDDMNLSVNAPRGFGWKEILAFAVLITGGTWALNQFRPQVPVAYPPQTPIIAPASNFNDTDTDSGIVGIKPIPRSNGEND